jgi:hypothetical protein
MSVKGIGKAKGELRLIRAWGGRGKAGHACQASRLSAAAADAAGFIAIKDRARAAKGVFLLQRAISIRTIAGVAMQHKSDEILLSATRLMF